MEHAIDRAVEIHRDRDIDAITDIDYPVIPMSAEEWHMDCSDYLTGIWQRNIEDARREAVRLMGGEAVGSKSFISRHDGWELFLERGSK